MQMIKKITIFLKANFKFCQKDLWQFIEVPVNKV